MARRKAQQRSISSGAPGIRNGMGSAPLNQLGLPHGYLDPSVRADEIRAGDNPLARFFDNQAAVDAWSQPARPIQ